MARICIRCKVHQDPAGKTGYPLINGFPASWADVEVVVVHNDGTEEHLHDVEEATWTCKAGSEYATATLKFIGVELDVEAEADLPDAPASPLPQ